MLQLVVHDSAAVTDVDTAKLSRVEQCVDLAPADVEHARYLLDGKQAWLGV